MGRWLRDRPINTQRCPGHYHAVIVKRKSGTRRSLENWDAVAAALTAVGVKVPTVIKKSVTTAQLTQFASCIVHAIAALFLDSTPIFYNGVQVLYHIGMLRLFLPLLLGKKKGAAGAKPPAVPATPGQKDSVKAD